jgi:hypothetical protein
MRGTKLAVGGLSHIWNDFPNAGMPVNAIAVRRVRTNDTLFAPETTSSNCNEYRAAKSITTST